MALLNQDGSTRPYCDQPLFIVWLGLWSSGMEPGGITCGSVQCYPQNNPTKGLSEMRTPYSMLCMNAGCGQFGGRMDRHVVTTAEVTTEVDRQNALTSLGSPTKMDVQTNLVRV